MLQNYLSKLKWNYDRENKKFKEKRHTDIDLPELSTNDMLILPCLAQAAMGEGNPTHKARVHLASYLASRMRWFFPPDSITDDEKSGHVEQIVNIILKQNWSDFDEDITTRQVISIVYGSGNNRGYLPATCRTLIQCTQ